MTRLDLSLYLVLDRALCRHLGMVETARLAVAGGVTAVQLRDKTASTLDLIAVGREIKSALVGTNVPLIVNDNIDAALALDADGVHLGQGDQPASLARSRLGAGLIVGLSVENAAAARSIDPAVVDYVGVGPVFATPTKPDHKPPIGFEGMARLIAMSPVPTVAIGGLKHEHIGSVLSGGADGLAVVSAICGQPDPQAAASRLAAEIARSRAATSIENQCQSS